MTNYFTYDFETTSLSTFHGGRPFIVAYKINDEPTKWTKNILEIKKYLEDENYIKIAHNLKFETHHSNAMGMGIKGLGYDTKIMAHLLDENSSTSLEYCADKYLGKKKLGDSVKDWLRKNKYTKARQKAERRSFYELVPDEIILPYVTTDTDLTWELYNIFAEMLCKQNLSELFLQECSLVKVLANMEAIGHRVDVPYLEKQIVELKPILDKLEQEVYLIVGKEFNMNSTQQLAEMLLSSGVKLVLGKPSPKTKKRNYKVDAETLETIEHPVIETLLKYREFKKFYTTYFVNILNEQVNGIVHCEYLQNKVTGRMGARRPNLQNIPRKDKRVKKAFIPREDYCLVYFDYDQIEYKIFAHYTEDEYLLKAILNGADFHQITADELDVLRDFAKQINFGLIYGMGDRALAKELGVSVQEASACKKRYFKRFATVNPFLEEVESTILKRGYIFNSYNRRRRLLKEEAYKGVNSLIQGSAGDFVKNRMIAVYKDLKGTLSRILLQIHDELVNEVHLKEMHLIKKTKDIMEDVGGKFSIPLTVSMAISFTNWGEKEKFKFIKDKPDYGITFGGKLIDLKKGKYSLVSLNSTLYKEGFNIRKGE